MGLGTRRGRSIQEAGSEVVCRDYINVGPTLASYLPLIPASFGIRVSRRQESETGLGVDLRVGSW